MNNQISSFRAALMATHQKSRELMGRLDELDYLSSINTACSCGHAAYDHYQGVCQVKDCGCDNYLNEFYNSPEFQILYANLKTDYITLEEWLRIAKLPTEEDFGTTGNDQS